MKEFGHNEQSVRVAVSRIMKQGWLQSEKVGNKSYYFLTPRGEARIEEAAIRIFGLNPKKWDGKWRMLMYTIPEEKRKIRDELRKELIWSGFGSFANGCWISPNNLDKEVHLLIEDYGIQAHVDFFVAEYQGPEKNRTLVEKGWPLEEIAEKHQQFISTYSEKYTEHQTMIDKKLMSDAACFVARTKLVHEYRKFLFFDPGLPKELLPQVWSGNDAAKLFDKYYRLLEQPASRFFEQVYREEIVSL
jgi:phenylacetic acid degradation operon negative regulatory protein